MTKLFSRLLIVLINDTKKLEYIVLSNDFDEVNLMRIQNLKKANKITILNVYT